MPSEVVILESDEEDMALASASLTSYYPSTEIVGTATASIVNEKPLNIHSLMNASSPKANISSANPLNGYRSHPPVPMLILRMPLFYLQNFLGFTG